MRTLWDLLDPAMPMRPDRTRPSPQPRPRASRSNSPLEPAAERYENMQRQMLAQHGVRVRKWRSGTSGVAWQVYYTDGTIARLIESPRPRGPMSAAVFLHEVGHHAIGFETYRPRCLEELHAWRFALEQMDAWGISITDRVRRRVHESLTYAVAKAQRRGLRKVPPELAPFTQGGVAPGDWVDPRASVASGPS
ncbi:MAG: hypothetical protein KJZ65_04980 [Phycisphaerales bacterium]|nr:hypothetical protein [Phycisphaerales bacterium]